MLVDSHCHLDFPDFADDLDGVVAAAARAGVGTMLTICTHVTRFAQVRAIAERYDNIFCTVGIHPHNAGSEPEVTAADLIALAEHPKVVGFGETGLDYYYEHSPRAAQQKSFRAHIRAARETGLPLVVHTRDADADTLAILTEETGAGAFPGLLHCFSSGRELAEKAVEMGFYISLSGIVTFKTAEELRAIARDLPLDRLLVETDAPYLAPVPKRGKRNEPAFTAHTAARVAETRGEPADAFAAATSDNFFRLFGKIDRAAPGVVRAEASEASCA
ncbi:MAG: TatD family hydrolase [Hyphomicrobiales bacterium]|nr:TatD family hydrolase [Hyphomicrobiales bacterium]